MNGIILPIAITLVVHITTRQLDDPATAFPDTNVVKALLAMLSALRLVAGSKHVPRAFAVRLGRRERRRIKEYTKPTRTRAK